MSRSTILIFLTFAVLVLLFSAYLFIAPQPAANYQVGNTLTPATRRATTAPTGSFGQGEGAWVKQFDERTGALASQFRGAQYDPQPDNTVKVLRPEAEFFLSDGQVLHIEGDTGVITVPESLKPGKDQVFNGPSRPPTRGDLKSVHIQLFKDGTTTAPTLTCEMDNATFDNETFRIFTQDAVIDGQTVPADQIPVTLRGVDYDFDGRGLTIRLNQRDRRLEYLEVTHGKRLVVKNPSKLNDQIPSGPTSAAPLAAPLPYMLADAGSGAGLPPLPVRPTTTKQGKKGAATPTTHDSGPAIYRASFQENVRVTQADQDLATGDELQIDFLFEDKSSNESNATTRKAKGSSTEASHAEPSSQASSGTADEGGKPAAKSALKGDGGGATTKVASSAPATRPAQPPVTIYWTGKLTMSPTSPGRAAADVPTAKNSIVHITGSPLHVRQGSSTIVGSALTYRTATQHLSLRGTDQFPLSLTDGKGAVVHGTSIDYLQQERLATLDGPGNATKVLPAQNPGEPAKQMASSWSRSATLFFTGQANEPLRIETAKLDGAVSVRHPQLSLKADTLKLDFDPASTTRPTTTVAVAAKEPKDKNAPPDFTASDLRHLDARGGVHATVTSANDRPQSIVADHLELNTASTADGRIYPKLLVADGSVVASDPDQELRAGHVKTTLLPGAAQAKTTTRGSKADAESVPVELEHLTATDNVSVKTADGVTASATRLDVDVDPQTRAQQVRLLGSPAHVSSKENSVTGPYIEILPAEQTYHVRGVGKMHLLQRETPESKPRPVDVAWTDAVAVDGKKNLIDVRGGVSVLSTDDNGTQNNATGDHLVITLADNPQAATKASTRKVATTRKAPITGIASTGDPMQNKTVQTITFEKGASLQSVQSDKATNDLLRQMNLMADLVNYDLPHKRVTVPVPGRMLFVNRQQQQQQQGGNDATGGVAGSRGDTAFSWAQQMVFDQSANVMVMTGDVAIVHEADASDKPFRLDADKVTATLAPKAGGPQQASPNQATPESVDLKHVTAEGTVRFTGKDMQLTASTVDYDPVSGMLIARGMGRDPVHLYDADGVQTGTTGEVQYDMKTGQIVKMVDVQAQTRRRTPR